MAGKESQMQVVTGCILTAKDSRKTRRTTLPNLNSIVQNIIGGVVLPKNAKFMDEMNISRTEQAFDVRFFTAGLVLI